MLEVELKAHVENRAETEKRLNSFAKFISHVKRDDVYYKGRISSAAGDDFIKIRLRCETDFSKNEKKYILTYKQKERRENEDGKAFEVNSEKECEISDTEAIEAFLGDAGFSVDLKKSKDVFDWKVETETGSVLCELCEVPPLGWFLELEILVSEEDASKNPEIIENARLQLEKTLENSGISKEKIENRYYSELLKGEKYV